MPTNKPDVIDEMLVTYENYVRRKENEIQKKAAKTLKNIEGAELAFINSIPARLEVIKTIKKGINTGSSEAEKLKYLVSLKEKYGKEGKNFEGEVISNIILQVKNLLKQLSEKQGGPVLPEFTASSKQKKKEQKQQTTWQRASPTKRNKQS